MFIYNMLIWLRNELEVLFILGFVRFFLYKKVFEINGACKWKSFSKYLGLAIEEDYRAVDAWNRGDRGENKVVARYVRVLEF
jgi:hypothetical protein